MKTLTTLAATAALIAGMSFANAQTPQGTQAAKPGMAGTGQFCMSTKDGPKNCTFASLKDCEAKAKGMKGTCAANTSNAANTTGQK
jgi:hypothetical protein